MGLPVEISNLQLAASGYTVGRSLRFRSSASAYLNRTVSSTTNRRTYTFSGWVKRGVLGTSEYIISAFNAGTNECAIRFNSNDTLEIEQYTSPSFNYQLVTTQVFRDPSAWYHIVVAVDTTQATSSNRIKLYVNGSQVTAFGTASYPSLNYDTNFNFGSYTNQIGAWNTLYFFDGYQAEVNFIDGQALTPSSFGAYDANGIWQPVKYSGTYGTNGFYLPFSNTTSTTTLVQDSSGNGNNWTPNNISLTAGTTYDSMIDSPTVSASSSNYAVLNAVNNFSIGLTGGNLDVNTTSAYAYASSTFSLPASGKWYWEFTDTSSATLANQRCAVGFGLQGYRSSTTYIGQLSTDWFYLGTSGNLFNNAAGTAYGATYTQNDVVGIAVDCATGKFWFSKNGTFQASGDPVAGTNQAGTISGDITTYCPMVGNLANSAGLSCVGSVNFGQRPFSYTPPTGYNALNTYNLPRPTIANGALYNAATLYTGTGANATITNSQSNGGNNALGKTFYPDFTWIKGRSGATDHALYDSVRGTTKDLVSNSTAAETTQSTGLTAFNTDGFNIGTLAKLNTNTATYVGWQWNAGSGSSSSNTSGSITSTVSVNQTAGFSVATYNGNGVAGSTIGHGLGVTPSMIITKARNNTSSWAVYHTSTGNTGACELNNTGAFAASSLYWNNTSPTSSVFTVGTGGTTNTNTYTYVAYCFAAVKGYSAFGSYTGNGSTDGPFCYLGFRPRWIMVKRTDAASNDWVIYDTSRNTYNATINRLFPDLSDVESTAAGGDFDILSNGFKVRSTYANVNASGGTYVYACFSENPFNYSRAR